MAANDESQSSFTPAGTGQMARARGDSDCIFGVAQILPRGAHKCSFDPAASCRPVVVGA